MIYDAMWEDVTVYERFAAMLIVWKPLGNMFGVR